MNPEKCSKYVSEDWLLWASQDLPFWRRRAMERHCATCPACTAIREETLLLFRQTQAAFGVGTPSSSLRSRIWSASGATSLDQKRAFSHRALLPGVAAGALAVGAVASFLLLVPGSPGHPTVAFAQVEQAVNQVRTATWTTRVEASSPSNLKERWTDSYENWVSLDHSRFAMFPPIDHKNRQAWFFKMVADGVHSLTSESRYQYRRADFFTPFATTNGSLRSSSSPTENLRRHILFPRTLTEEPSEQNPSNEANRVTRGPWKSAKDSLDGKTVLRFETRFTYHFADSVRKGRPHLVDYIAWVDPQSYLFVRQETITHTENMGDIRTVRENFRYNEPTPPGTFDIPPPPVGQPYAYSDSSKDGWLMKRPPADEQKAIEAVVQKAVVSWNRHDAVNFASLWDFQYGDLERQVYQPGRRSQETAEDRKRHWTNRLRQGVPYKTWEIQKIWTAEAWGGIWIRQKESDHFPPDTRPRDYFVTVTGYARIGKSSQPTLCDAVFRIVRTGTIFRIKYISMYPRQTVSRYSKPGPVH